MIEAILTKRREQQRVNALEAARLKSQNDAEAAEIQVHLDDVASIMGRPINDPLVIALAVRTLRRRPRSDEDATDLGYPTFEF